MSKETKGAEAPVKKKKKKKQHKKLAAFFTVVLMLFMVGVVTGGMVCLDLFTNIGIISLKGAAREIPGIDYIDLDSYVANQDQTTIIYAYDGDGNEVELARLHGAENRIWCSLNDICQDMQDAVIALEDKRFPTHKGVDWVRTIGVTVQMNGQGGSTITQQLIKNLTDNRAVTFQRKFNEIKNALALEKHFEKDQILEAYLNTIYLDMGCYGVKTGAEYYFGKTPAELTLMESAILASITNAPRYYDPIINYDNNRTRAIECLDCMLEQGYIDQAEYDGALKEKVQFVGIMPEEEETDEDAISEDSVEVTVSSDDDVQSFYVDHIINQVIEDLQETYGLTESEAWRKVYFGGLKIYGAVDLEIQQILDDVYFNRSVCFPDEEDTESNPAIQSAMVIMNYEGRVMGLAGRIGKKTENRSWNIATMSTRQPGSTIKPISVYAPAIELNAYYWSSKIPNYGINIPGMSRAWPTNYGGDPGNKNQLLTLDAAIAPSKNTIPARIVETLSPKTCFEFLRDRFHISTLTPIDSNYAPMAIGAMANGLIPLEVCASYVPFANHGLYYKPWSYYKVTNNLGTEVILEPDREGEQVISAGTADVMRHLLECVVKYTSGTGYRFGIRGQVSFSKSGTTSDNCDKWIIGGTPYYICASWTGFDEMRPINTYYYGSNPAGTVYQYVMNKIHANLEYKTFEDTDECVQRSYCVGTGLLAGSKCTRATGYYKVDNLPAVCHCNGGTGEAADEDETTTKKPRDDDETTTKKPKPGDETTRVIERTTKPVADDTTARVTEPVTEPPTEPKTEPPTEPKTEPKTDPPTEATTKKPTPPPAEEDPAEE